MKNRHRTTRRPGAHGRGRLPAWLGVVCALAAALTLSAAAAGGSDPQAGPLVEVAGSGPQTGGYVLPQDKQAITPASGSQLVNHGGPVMTSNTNYAIYWIPSGYTVSSSYRTVIDGYFTNLQAASGHTDNVYGVATQYSGSNGAITTSSTFAGSVVDTTAFPASGCSDIYTGVCLTDAQLRTEILAVANANGWTPSATKMFFLFTPQNVGSCMGTHCSFTDYCAYHGFIPTSHGNLIYANQPYANFVPVACNTGQASPNTDADADTTLNVVSHEHIEAITDPTLGTWYDGNGAEIGDKCNFNFGPALPFNQTISSGHYVLQQEWSNASSACALTYAGTAPTPKITGFSPGKGPVGTQVTINGTGLTGASAVRFNGKAAASYNVVGAGTITAVVAAGSTTGKISVTTPGGTATSKKSFRVK